MIQKLTENIVAIIKDYHNYCGFQFTTDHIINWVNQFDESDREFILAELLHLLQQGIYISEEKAKQLLIARIESEVINKTAPAISNVAEAARLWAWPKRANLHRAADPPSRSRSLGPQART
jgi:glutamate-1-semialdehyde aminotransferase